MLTTRMRPKIRAKPLATMNRAPANVIESSNTLRNEPGSLIAEPNVVVRQPPPPVAGDCSAITATERIEKRPARAATIVGTTWLGRADLSCPRTPEAKGRV